MFVKLGVTLSLVLLLPAIIYWYKLWKFRNKVKLWQYGIYPNSPKSHIHDPMAIKISVKQKNGKAAVEFRKCYPLHVFDNNTINVKFLSPKRWQGYTTRTVPVSDIYPVWAVTKPIQ